MGLALPGFLRAAVLSQLLHDPGHARRPGGGRGRLRGPRWVTGCPTGGGTVGTTEGGGTGWAVVPLRRAAISAALSSSMRSPVYRVADQRRPRTHTNHHGKRTISAARSLSCCANSSGPIGSSGAAAGVCHVCPLDVAGSELPGITY